MRKVDISAIRNVYLFHYNVFEYDEFAGLWRLSRQMVFNDIGTTLAWLNDFTGPDMIVPVEELAFNVLMYSRQ